MVWKEKEQIPTNSLLHSPEKPWESPRGEVIYKDIDAMNNCGFSPQGNRFSALLINIQNCLREVLISAPASLLWDSPNSLKLASFSGPKRQKEQKF